MAHAEFDELKQEVELLGVRDSVLDETGFRAHLHRVTHHEPSVGRSESDMPWPRLRWSRVKSPAELIEAIDVVFDAKGQIRDNASPELEAIRADLTAVRRKSTSPSCGR